MSDKENPFNSYVYEETEQHKFHERVMEKFDNLSLEEKVQRLKDIGILNEDGDLSEKYGGSGTSKKVKKFSEKSSRSIIRKVLLDKFQDLSTKEKKYYLIRLQGSDLEKKVKEDLKFEKNLKSLESIFFL